MNNISSIAFKYRSYTPIPFLIVMLIFQKSTPLTLIIGFAVALIGELIRFWGVSWAGSETRATGGVGGTFLIISGPFAYVRNPLYVGNIMLYLGLGIMSFALFPYLQIVAIIFFLIQYYFIVGEEEKYLSEKFKDHARERHRRAHDLQEIAPVGGEHLVGIERKLPLHESAELRRVRLILEAAPIALAALLYR